MKYWGPILTTIEMLKRRSVLAVLVLMALVAHPMTTANASAGLTAQEGGGDLYLSCRADNDCVLTPTPIGEETVSGQSSANLFQEETVTFEFNADPAQEHVAVSYTHLRAHET